VTSVLTSLIKHQWKEKTRSSFWQKNIALNIILGILALYLILNLILLSYFADTVLQKVFEGQDVVSSFTNLLLYYFLFDLIIRFLLQQLPTLSIQPYLSLPIKKSKLLHYPLIKSVTGFFNIIPLLLILPFYFKNIASAYSLQFSVIWLLSVLSLIFFNNFLTFSVKKYFSKQPLILFLLFAIVGLILFLNYSNYIYFSEYFTALIFYLADNPALIIFPLALAVFAYFLAYRLLKSNAYIEDVRTTSIRKDQSLSFLNQYGEIGQLLSVEIKMILRNKRPRSLLFISAIFMFYGFFLSDEKNINSDLMTGIVFLLLTSIFSINYGQYYFSWDSSYFDSYMANNVSVANYIKSKQLLFSLACILTFIISLPYAYFGIHLIFISTAFLLYNIGISSIIMLYLCTYNTSYIDLGRSQFMNYQGTGVTQFLIVLPIMGIPVLLYVIFKSLGYSEFYFYSVAAIGILGIILNKFFMQLIIKQFNNRKYKMAAGFRKN